MRGELFADSRVHWKSSGKLLGVGKVIVALAWEGRLRILHFLRSRPSLFWDLC